MCGAVGLLKAPLEEALDSLASLHIQRTAGIRPGDQGQNGDAGAGISPPVPAAEVDAAVMDDDDTPYEDFLAAGSGAPEGSGWGRLQPRPSGENSQNLRKGLRGLPGQAQTGPEIWVRPHMKPILPPPCPTHVFHVPSPPSARARHAQYMTISQLRDRHRVQRRTDRPRTSGRRLWAEAATSLGRTFPFVGGIEPDTSVDLCRYTSLYVALLLFTSFYVDLL